MTLSLTPRALLSLSLLTATATTSRADAPMPAGRCEGALTWLAGDATPDGTPPAARELATWLAVSPSAAVPGLAQSTPDALDAELLDPEAIASLNQRNVETIGAWRDPLADVPPAFEATNAELEERLSQIAGRVGTGEYVPGPRLDSDDYPPPGAFDAVRDIVENALPVDAVQGVVEPIDLHCVPFAYGLYRTRVDRWFDRNQCSLLQPGDLVRVVRRGRDGWLYVRVGHGVGWIQDAVLSPPLSPAAARDLRERPRLAVTGDLVPARGARGELTFLRFGSALPLVDDAGDHYQVLVPGPRGFTDAFIAKTPYARELHEGTLPLTRRNVLTLAFARLGDPYGWGGLGGFRDCSGLLLDLVALFDVRLGRNSSVQVQAGAEVVDVAGQSDDAKLAAIRAANARGIVFLYMPGHIMLHLGELDGRAYALSALSEYLLPCPEGGHRTVRIDRVDVTDLERGRGTERTAFLERITTLAIFGP